MSVAREFAEYGSAAGHKLLSDNRDLYVRQSAATRNGNVAPFPRPRTHEQSAIPSDGVRGSFYSEPHA